METRSNNIQIMKQYTQKQMDSAKERAYKKGFAHGTESAEAVSQAHYEDVLDSANEIKQWKKWEQYDFDWTIAILVAVCLGVVVSMILANVPVSVI
jgi:hypothetical protein